MIKMPYLLDDETLTKTLDLPENVEPCNATTAHRYWRVDYDGFLKRVILRITKMHYLLDDETLIEKLDLPENVEPCRTAASPKKNIN